MPEKAQLNLFDTVDLAVSPDGKRIVFGAFVGGRRTLWLRELDSEATRQIASAEGNSAGPFWAPDSRRLGFWSEGKLKQLDLAGGPPVTIAEVGRTRGCTWGAGDIILISTQGQGLRQVSAAGGKPEFVTEPDKSSGERDHLFPSFLPDGRHYLYKVQPGGSVFVGEIGSKVRQRVLPDNTNAIYSAGHLLFLRESILMAQSFDLGKLATNGVAFPVAEQLNQVNAGAAGYFSASLNGVLAFARTGQAGGPQLTWFDRVGKNLGTLGPQAIQGTFAISPDGNFVVSSRQDQAADHWDLWIRDVVRGSDTRFTFEGNSRSPAWSADGSTIYFDWQQQTTGARKLYKKAANGAGKPELAADQNLVPWNASRDGRYLLAWTPNGLPKTRNDLWVVPLAGGEKPYPYLQTEFEEGGGKVSPDGRWLAYHSNESKRDEIYVGTFPQPGGKWQVSTNGGGSPNWSHDGRELFYYGNGKMMAVEIKPGPTFQAGAPKELFEVRLQLGNTGFDVHKDGRFLLPVLPEQSGAVPMTVILNWPQLARK